jgi:hypothetical protein
VTTRKQAARDRKRRVHGWESDELEAAEPVEPVETGRRPRKPTVGGNSSGGSGSGKASSSSGKASSSSSSGGRRLYRDGEVIVYGRQRVQRPTWRRTLIRTAVFLPVMFVIVHFLFSSSKLTPRDELVLILGYAVVTIGVMHLTETWRYNRLDKQLAEQSTPRKRR